MKHYVSCIIKVLGVLVFLGFSKFGTAGNLRSRNPAKPKIDASAFYTLVKLDCRIQEKSGEKWIESKGVFSRDEVYSGIVSKILPGKIIFKNRESQFYLADEGCLAPLKSGFFSRLKSLVSIYAFLGFSSFADNMEIVDNDTATASPLRVNNVALCAGLGMTYTRTWFDLSLDSCGFYGKANLTNSEVAASTTYTALNADIFGIQNTLHFLWVPRSGQVDFGLAIPINIKSVVWPVPAAHLAITPATGISTGVLLEARFERGPFLFTQNVGFLGHWGNYIYNVQAAWVY